MGPASLVRLPWIDHVRTFVIILMVNLHACISYSHVGDWYFMSDHEPTMAEKVPFIVWQGHLQAFFMGLLFFISGYFAHLSLGRRGAAQFLRERLFRLGLPALLYMLVIHPFILLVLNPWGRDFGPPAAFYVKYLQSGRFLGSTGPLWFAVALLFFCLLLVSWRLLRRQVSRGDDTGAVVSSQRPAATFPSAAILSVFTVGLSLGTFAMRLVQPIGTNVLNMQLCFFVQYVAFFVLGVHAARHGWLLPLAASSRARTAGWMALVGGPLLLLALVFAVAKAGKLEHVLGGWHWEALGFALWEQAAGVGLSLGVLALFSRKADVESPRLRWLSERSFGVYVLHAPVLVGLAMAFRALPQNTYVLAALLTVTGLLVSYLAADLIRRVPVFRAIF
jgi:glucans biosynthesis protein C